MSDTGPTEPVDADPVDPAPATEPAATEPLGFGGGADVAADVGETPPTAGPAPPPSPPVTVRARLDEPLHRWLWLVKWILVIPHIVVLVVLWIAFLVLTFIAGVAIVFTGRYPRGIFDFNLGVMRWSWRVQLYAFTLTTDRYPPFTLDAVPDYPAELDIAYPESLSRGLVWVKWWLLAIPHYVLVGIFLGGPRLGLGGLVGFLALVAGVHLAIGRRYPTSIFDFVMGMHRWAWRV
ncbi:MAG TPA: DUF4389 domain-containing protein, partial [Acidimicrobiales bacterium]